MANKILIAAALVCLSGSAHAAGGFNCARPCSAHAFSEGRDASTKAAHFRSAIRPHHPHANSDAQRAAVRSPN
jgi:hypothetical protein